MEKYYVFYCFCFPALFLSSLSMSENSNSNPHLQLVRDFVKSYNFPLLVTNLACWDYKKTLALHKVLPITMIRTPSLNQSWHHNGTTNSLQQHELFLIDSSSQSTFEILKIANEKRLFGFPHTWLILNDNSNDSVVQSLDSLSVLPDSNVIIAEMQTSPIYELYQVYKPSADHVMIREHYGTWSEHRGVKDDRTTHIISRRRKNLMGIVLKQSLVFTHNTSIAHLDDYEDSNIDSITRMCYRLTNNIWDAINASKSYSHVQTWGYPDPKIPGIWTGMIGELLRGEAETGTSLFFTANRIDIIEYITMMSSTQIRFVFRAPPLSYINNLYLLPFGRGVWIACGVLVLVMVLAMSVASISETEIIGGVFSRLSENLLVTLSAICQQGYPVIAKSPAVRITVLLLFVAFMFLYTSYTANIVSLLQSSTFSIRTLKDMLHSRLGFGVDDTVYNRYYFEHASEPTRKAIYEKKIAPKGAEPRFMNMTEGVRKLRQGFFAFHMERGSGYKLIQKTFYEHEKCGLIEVDYLSMIDPWMPIRKRSPYKEIIKVNAFKIRENGLQSREQSHYYTKKPECITGGASFRSVGLLDCYFGVMILAIGLVAACLLLMIEKLWYKMQLILNSSDDEPFEYTD